MSRMKRSVLITLLLVAYLPSAGCSVRGPEYSFDDRGTRDARTKDGISLSGSYAAEGRERLRLVLPLYRVLGDSASEISAMRTAIFQLGELSKPEAGGRTARGGARKTAQLLRDIAHSQRAPVELRREAILALWKMGSGRGHSRQAASRDSSDWKDSFASAGTFIADSLDTKVDDPYLLPPANWPPRRPAW